MRILHSSDLHGSYKPLLACSEPFDVWVDTGDFFPNRGRVARTGFTILAAEEVRFQGRWLGFKQLPARLAAWLAGRPALSVPGNHDFVSLASALRTAGADAHGISPGGVSAAGLRWAGFREIPWMEGEWPGECRDFGGLVDLAWACAPDVIVTHAPPAGILDGSDRLGVPELAEAHAARPPVRAHLFGHEHEDGGRSEVRGSTLFSNAATTFRVVEV